MKKYTKEQIKKAILHWFSKPASKDEVFDWENMNAEEIFNASKDITDYICDYIDAERVDVIPTVDGEDLHKIIRG